METSSYLPTLESQKATRILLADDQPEVRSALRLLLEQESGLQVCVAEAGDGPGLLRTAQDFQPELVLLDWELPGFQPQLQLQTLRVCVNPVAVVAMSGRPEARLAAFEAGVDGFVSKIDPPDRVLALVTGCINK